MKSAEGSEHLSTLGLSSLRKTDQVLGDLEVPNQFAVELHVRLLHRAWRLDISSLLAHPVKPHAVAVIMQKPLKGLHKQIHTLQ